MTTIRAKDVSVHFRSSSSAQAGRLAGGDNRCLLFPCGTAVAGLYSRVWSHVQVLPAATSNDPGTVPGPLLVGRAFLHATSGRFAGTRAVGIPVPVGDPGGGLFCALG